MIDLHPDHLKQVLKILEEHLPDYTVWVFGSRATSTARANSDLDLAIKTDQPLPASTLHHLEEAFSESNLPFKVDLTDWAVTSESFREIIQNTHQIIRLGGTPKDAILALLDVVGYTPQAREGGGQKTEAFDQYITEEIKKRVQSYGFSFIKSIGDAVLLWGEGPENLVELILDIFKENPIQPNDGFIPRFRMLAHKDYFQFSRNEQGQVVDVHGLEAILLFRLEKTAHLNRVIVTDHLFSGMRHLLEPAGIESQEIDLQDGLKGLSGYSPRQVHLLTPPLAEETKEMEMPKSYLDKRETLRRAQGLLLKRMLTHEVWEEYQNQLSAQTEDPADPNIDNINYYQSKFSRAIVRFYGSPNFHHGEIVNALAFSKDSKEAVSASNDGLLILWEVASGREIRRFSGHNGRVSACAFSPDGGRLLSGSWDSTLKLWDSATGKEIRTLTGHENDVTSCAFSPNPNDGRLLSGSSDCTLKLWDSATGKEIRTLTRHNGWVTACAFSPDGGRLLSGSSDYTLKLWDSATGKEIRTLTGHNDWVAACAFSPDGGRLLSGSWDNTLKLWDSATGTLLETFEVGWKVLAIALHPTMPGHVVAALQNGTLALIEYA